MQTIEHFVADLARQDPHQPELLQAVSEVARSIWPVLHEREELKRLRVFERLIEPDRVLQFRVEWEDDEGQVHVERGYRVQQSNLLGPYKGGLRFHPSVDLGVLRFLAFEQVFKDALTGLPMGGGKGGSSFNPRGRSDAEIQRFCRSFMTELGHHIGADLDVPAGDIGVGGRELGFLYGAYRRLYRGHEGVLTGKGVGWGGIEMRVEATGYGLVYIVERALARSDRSLDGLRCAVSGAGNVALHAAEKAIALGGQVISLSNSTGLALFPDGMTADQLAELRERRENHERLEGCSKSVGFDFLAGRKPWGLDGVQVALACATQNEMDDDDAALLLASGELVLVAEGANMPLTADAAERIEAADVLYLPGKAANAGGVSVSGLEMAQNAGRQPWTRERADEALQERMQHIHDACVEHGAEGARVDYVTGANRAAFARLAEAVLAMGHG